MRSGGIGELEAGVAGVGDEVDSLELGDGVTGPGGGGSEVAGLADPGRTTGFESFKIGFLSSAYPLCI